MRFRPRQNESAPASPNTVLGVGSNFRGTLMVSGTLRIDGEFDGAAEKIVLGTGCVLCAPLDVVGPVAGATDRSRDCFEHSRRLHLELVLHMDRARLI